MNDETFLGQGNTAEIYQYGEGRILKLFRQQMPYLMIEREYKVTKVVQEYLDNIPKAYELIERDQRHGIVYEQIKGVDMTKAMIRNLFGMNAECRRLAAIHYRVHEQNIDVGFSLKDKLAQNMNGCTELTSEEKNKIIQYMETLPDGTKLCHLDFHPGNIMLQDGKYYVIDWMTACTGDAAADVARTVLLMQMGEMMHISPLMRRVLSCIMRAIGKKYLHEYIRLSGRTEEEIEKWMLPIAAARLAEWLTDHERGRLVLLIREKLRQLP